MFAATDRPLLAPEAWSGPSSAGEGIPIPRNGRAGCSLIISLVNEPVKLLLHFFCFDCGTLQNLDLHVHIQFNAQAHLRKIIGPEFSFSCAWTEDTECLDDFNLFIKTLRQFWVFLQYPLNCSHPFGQHTPSAKVD